MKIYENKNLNEMKKIVSTYTKQTSDPEIERAVDDILEDVRVNQDDALRKYSEKFDGVKINDFRVPKEALNKAYDSIDDKLKNIKTDKTLSEHCQFPQVGNRKGFR